MPDFSRRYSFRWLSVWLILFSLVVVSGTAYTLQRLYSEAVNQHYELAAMHARLFENYLTHHLNLIGLTLGHALELDSNTSNTLDTTQTTARLHDMLRRSPSIRSLSLIDAQGRIIASSNPRNLQQQINLEALLPPASQTQALLRLERIWQGRDFYNGRPASDTQPAAVNQRIFLPLLLEPPNADAPRALAAVNPDFMLNYFLNSIPIEQGVVDVLRYDSRLLFSSDAHQPPGQLRSLPHHIDLSNKEFGRLDKNAAAQASFGAFRASRHFPLVVQVFFAQEWGLSAWRAEAKSIASVVSFSLLSFLLVSFAAYYFLRKAAQREREAQRQTRLAAKVYAESEEGIMVIDAQQKVLLINPAFTRITGYSWRDLQVRGDAYLLAHLSQLKDAQDVWQVLQQQGHWRGEIQHRHKNGQPIYIELKLSQLSTKSSETVRYVAIFSDITEQKQANMQLRQLSLAVEQSPSSVVIADLDGNIQYVNKAFCDITGYRYEEVIGQNPRILNSGLTPKETYEEMWEYLTNGQAWEGDFFNRRKDQSIYIEHAQIAPLFTEGRATHYVAVKHDISEMRALTENLRQAKEAAEAANRVKDSFIANMSHELRTPLNVILGFAHILQEAEDMPPQHKDEAVRIYRSGQQLLALVNDILEISKVETTQIELSLQETLIVSFLEEIAELFRAQANAKKLNFIYRSQNLPHSVQTDSQRVRQLLSHLLNNALKFTEQGSVELAADYADGRLHLRIKDSGIGIPREHQDSIFQAFTKIQKQSYKQGSGLGLFLARKIIKLLDGQLAMESQAGQGTCFDLILPMKTLRQTASSQVPTDAPTPTAQAKSAKQKNSALNAQQRAELSVLLDNGAMTELIDYLEKLHQQADDSAEIAELFSLAESFQLDEIQQKLGG